MCVKCKRNVTVIGILTHTHTHTHTQSTVYYAIDQSKGRLLNKKISVWRWKIHFLYILDILGLKKKKPWRIKTWTFVFSISARISRPGVIDWKVHLLVCLAQNYTPYDSEDNVQYTAIFDLLKIRLPRICVIFFKVKNKSRYCDFDYIIIMSYY